MVEFDRYLSALTRRASFVPGVWRLTRPLADFYSRFYRQPGRNRWTVVRHRDGSLMKVDRSTAIGSALFWYGYHSIDELCVLGTLLESDMVFVDIGANQGEFTLYAGRRITAGRILAFEPMPRMFAQLQENIQLNGLTRVVVHNTALSNHAGSMTIHAAADAVNEGLGTLYPTGADFEPAGTVQLEVFDDVCRRHNLERLDVMKLDVEGSELAVLRGAQASLVRFQPILMLELNRPAFAAAGYTPEALIDYLRSLGYHRLSLIEKHRQVIPLDDFTVPLPDLCNVIAYSSASTRAAVTAAS
jgi:FkbM family methyltransferase